MPNDHRSSRRLSAAFFIFIVFQVAASVAHAAAPVCLQGNDKNTQIHDMIMSAKPDAKGSLLEQYAYSKEDAALKAISYLSSLESQKSACESLHKPSLKEIFEQGNKLLEASSHLKIKHECFVASMKRNHKNDEYFCASSEVPSRDNPDKNLSARISLGKQGKNNQCVSDQMVDYVNWAFNEAIACMSDPRNPIDPVTVFALMNNESTFHFYTAYVGGVGIGQLTTSAIDAVNKHPNVPDYLKMVRDSKNPHCSAFKNALQQPLKNSYDNKSCPLIQPSDGLARALIYSLSYFLMNRDYLMTDVLKTFKAAHEERASFYNYAALVMYGPEALKNEGVVSQAYKESKGNFQKFKTLMDERVDYAKDTMDKAKEVVDSPDTNPSIKNIGDCLYYD